MKKITRYHGLLLNTRKLNSYHAETWKNKRYMLCRCSATGLLAAFCDQPFPKGRVAPVPATHGREDQSEKAAQKTPFLE